jgi:hypothetical protein
MEGVSVAKVTKFRMAHGIYAGYSKKMKRKKLEYEVEAMH